MNKLPIPVCIAFWTCRDFGNNTKTQEELLIGLPRYFWSKNFPSAFPLCFFVRCTSAHGDYSFEIQMQNAEGEVVWKGDAPDAWVMKDPLEMYDMKFRTNVVFPAPGIYQFVLVLNGEELTRQRFHAKVRENENDR